MPEAAGVPRAGASTGQGDSTSPRINIEGALTTVDEDTVLSEGVPGVATVVPEARQKSCVCVCVCVCVVVWWVGVWGGAKRAFPNACLLTSMTSLLMPWR